MRLGGAAEGFTASGSEPDARVDDQILGLGTEHCRRPPRCGRNWPSMTLRRTRPARERQNSDREYDRAARPTFHAPASVRPALRTDPDAAPRMGKVDSPCASAPDLGKRAGTSRLWIRWSVTSSWVSTIRRDQPMRSTTRMLIGGTSSPPGEKVGRAIAQDVCGAGDSDRADDERRRNAVYEAALKGEGEHLVIGRLGDDAGVGHGSLLGPVCHPTAPAACKGPSSTGCRPFLSCRGYQPAGPRLRCPARSVPRS